MKYSPLEEKLLALIPADGSSISSRRLIELFYGDEEPFNARAITIARITGLQRKVELMESWRLRKSKRRGPHPVEVWRERV